MTQIECYQCSKISYNNETISISFFNTTACMLKGLINQTWEITILKWIVNFASYWWQQQIQNSCAISVWCTAVAHLSLVWHHIVYCFHRIIYCYAVLTRTQYSTLNYLYNMCFLISCDVVYNNNFSCNYLGPVEVYRQFFYVWVFLL